MADVRVLVLRAAGINCDEEVMHCWSAAGATPTLAHLNSVLDTPSMLEEFQIVTIPGGFSYGDDIAAGVIFAQRIATGLADAIRRLVERGGGVLGICNGFQILVKCGLLPDPDHQLVPDRREVTVTYNDSARFEARWVRLKVCTDRCVFLTPGTYLEMPVEHAEGKVVTDGDTVAADLERTGHVAVRYVDVNDRSDRYPANPNGSVSGIAGLCDTTGRILGLMPHPDRHFEHTHHPQWTSRRVEGPPDGFTVFTNAVCYWRG